MNQPKLLNITPFTRRPLISPKERKSLESILNEEGIPRISLWQECFREHVELEEPYSVETLKQDREGACLQNAKRLVDKLLSEGIPEKNIYIFYMVNFDGGGISELYMNNSSIRPEERDDENGSQPMGYHVLVAYRKDDELISIDLTLDDDQWGTDITTAVESGFLEGDSEALNNELKAYRITPETLAQMDQGLRRKEQRDIRDIVSDSIGELVIQDGYVGYSRSVRDPLTY